MMQLEGDPHRDSKMLSYGDKGEVGLLQGFGCQIGI